MRTILGSKTSSLNYEVTTFGGILRAAATVLLCYTLSVILQAENDHAFVVDGEGLIDAFYFPQVQFIYCLLFK